MKNKPSLQHAVIKHKGVSGLRNFGISIHPRQNLVLAA